MEIQELIDQARERIEVMLDNGHAKDSPHILEEELLIKGLEGLRDYGRAS